ncbi:MAG TPA: SIMPL domain-containing protein [Stellaceae bacterium]
MPMRAGFGLAVAVWLLAIPALADEPAPTLLHLNQTAERGVTRDRLTVALRVEASGRDPRAVQAEVNRRMGAALAKARAVTAVETATGGYESYQSTPTGADGKPTGPAQWHTVQELSLRARDFAAALALAGQLQADGLLISDMRFDVAPDTLHAQEQSLTDEALNALRARARHIAETLGLKVARFRTLNVGNATLPGGGPRPMLMMRAGGGAPAPMPPAAAAGDATVTVSVNAEITLEPAP